MIEFEWQVPVDGFGWRVAAPIVDNLIQRRHRTFLAALWPPSFRTSHPLRDTPALFHSFGDLKPTAESVLAFANQYGALGTGLRIITVDDNKGSRGESLSEWRSEIVHMRHALRVWQALNLDDRNGLRRWFSLDDQGDLQNVRYTPDEPWPAGVGQVGVQFTSNEIGDVVRWLHGGDGAPSRVSVPKSPSDMARAWLRMVVDTRLRDHTSARVLYSSNSSAAASRRPSAQRKPRRSGLQLQIVPRNLLGALWLQLARAIDGGRAYRTCKVCRKWFEVSTHMTGKRSDAEHCGPGCRVRAHRDAKRLERENVAKQSKSRRRRARTN